MILREIFKAKAKAKAKSVGIIFGRFNPPHMGHMKAWEMASENSSWYVGTNKSTQGPKDPLPFDIKVKAMEAVYPEVKGHIVAETSWLTLASKVYEKHGNIVLNVYTDEDWVTKTLIQYNGKEGTHGYYEFGTIQQQTTPRLSSATSLRNAVAADDRDLFGQAAGVDPNTLVAGHAFFDVVKHYLMPHAEKAAAKAAKKQVKEPVAEGWSQKYKKSINCSHPKGFSQKAHCAGKKKHNESVEMEMVCEDCGMCETHGSHLQHSLGEACWKGYHKDGMKTMFGKRYPNCIKNKKESLETYINRGECPGCGGAMVAEGQLNEKQDACYHKVKSRYKVWPSAYASGALVQCRKKGAANWGNSNESITQEDYDALDENLKKWFSDKWVRFGPDGKIKGDCARGDSSEGKPKCLPQSKAHSLGKKGRASAASRKRREDPNPERSGKAINVKTKKSSNKSVAENKLGNVIPWPEVVNKVNSAMKATGWKGKRMGEESFMYTTKGQETDDQWYVVMIANAGEGFFTYALGTVEDGDPHIDDAFKGNLPNTEASVIELLNEIRDGFGLNENVTEGTSIESTLRAVINDIGEPITNVYDTMKFQAKKYMENHGELDRGFRMVAAGIGGRWVQSMYVGRLQNELYDLCKYNTRRTVELKQFLRGIETDGELEMKRSFGSIANELPRILAKLGQHLGAAQLTKNANRWMQNKAAYEEYIANLELEDDYDEPAVAKSPKNPAIGQQRSQVEDIINDVLSKLPKKIAGDIRNAIARSPNKLQALQAELQKRNVKEPTVEATFKKSPYGRTAASQQRAKELLNPPKPPEPKKNQQGVAEGKLVESAIFLNPNTVIVGQQHGQPLELPPKTLKKVQAIAAKHGAWYEGNGTDRSYTKGQIDRYVGSWDDEVAKTANSNDPKWLYVLFANVDENNRVQRVGVDPNDTIFNRLLDTAKDNSFQGIGYTSQALQKFLQMASEGKYDFLKMSQQPATQKNLTRFLKAGEALMWPSNWEQYPNKAGKIAKAATVDVRDQYLATRKAGVYVTGSGHLKAVQNITGDYDRGNKRFKDINKATMKQFDNDKKDSLKEFSRGNDRDDEGGDDPYKYPEPEHFSRSIDFFGQFEADHFDKEDMNDNTGEFKGYWDYDGKLKQIAYFKFDNPKRTGSNHPGMGWYYEPQNEGVSENYWDRLQRERALESAGVGIITKQNTTVDVNKNTPKKNLKAFRLA